MILPQFQKLESSSNESNVGMPFLFHFNDFIMSAMVSQITGITILYSTDYSRCRSKKTSKFRVTGLCQWNSPVTGEFPAQRTSNTETVSIWWRHHDRWNVSVTKCMYIGLCVYLYIYTDISVGVCLVPPVYVHVYNHVWLYKSVLMYILFVYCCYSTSCPANLSSQDPI